MLVIVLPDAQAVSHAAADIVAATVTRRPAATIGLAAGATPLGMYGELVRRHNRGDHGPNRDVDGLDFSGTTLFGLDEYLGLTPDHRASCAHALKQHFIDRVQPDSSRVHLLGEPGDDAAAYCDAYERAIAAAGGLDLQILGLGVNGHIGFNEPGCSLAGRTHVVGLSAATRTTNRPNFPPPDDVPRTAITMGIATILSARKVMLLATGPGKAAMVAAMIEGPLSARIPASSLQMHPDAVVLLDEQAASGLTLRLDYDAEASARYRLAAGGPTP
jgi:glucosamine-6-phosphate deaminase